MEVPALRDTKMGASELPPRNVRQMKIWSTGDERVSSCPKTFLALALASASTFALAGSSDWRAPASAANRPNPVPANANAIAVGKKLYAANCLGCHGPEG